MKETYQAYSTTYCSNDWNEVHIIQKTHPGQENQQSQYDSVEFMHKHPIVNRNVVFIITIFDLIVNECLAFEVYDAAQRKINQLGRLINI